MDSIFFTQNKKFSGGGKEFTTVSRAVGKAERVIYTDNSFELANHVKIYHGSIVLLHFIDPRRMGLLTEQCAE